DRLVLRSTDATVRAHLALEGVHVAHPAHRRDDEQVTGALEPGRALEVRRCALRPALERVLPLGAARGEPTQSTRAYGESLPLGRAGDDEPDPRVGREPGDELRPVLPD